MKLDNFTASMSANANRDNFQGQGVNHTLPVFWSRRFNVNGVRHRRIKVYIDSNLDICQNPACDHRKLAFRTFCPSPRPKTLPNVVSNSTVEASWSLLLLMPSRPTTGANFRLLGIPVHPRYIDFCAGLPLTFPEEGRY